ncbi:MAG: hypothetical protein MI863_07300 [Desulfobacterales bacterium]|nr:hypothetical protein [Desulfobacterales bacterium]
MQKIIELVEELEGSRISKSKMATLEVFASKDLSQSDIKEALLNAYNKVGIEKPWNYFCAICWRIIKRTDRGSEGETVGSYGKFPWS